MIGLSPRSQLIACLLLAGVGLALLLSSPASDYITGQTIAADGGFLAGGSWSAE